MYDHHFTVTAETEWPFEDNDPNWTWCKENATFSHKEACEFIIHIGSREGDAPYFFEMKINEMRKGGCTEDFIHAYEAAAEAGAVRVLFYA